tara:strand:+ start:915 stop:1130 length:216 start_codon:yes stop_codon:yes gene_type:complete
MTNTYPLTNSGLYELRCDIKNLVDNVKVNERVLAALPKGHKLEKFHQDKITEIENEYCKLRQELRNRKVIN